MKAHQGSQRIQKTPPIPHLVSSTAIRVLTPTLQKAQVNPSPLKQSVHPHKRDGLGKTCSDTSYLPAAPTTAGAAVPGSDLSVCCAWHSGETDVGHPEGDPSQSR